jgi:urease accessory protein
VNDLSSQQDRSGWQAQLSLRFENRGQRTLLTYRHRGPLRVQRPFYPEIDGTCHVYILHPPGGVVAGDVLNLEAELDPGAQAVLTTPAANKFYRSNAATAYQTQILRAAVGAALEWLPQETIVFEGAQAQTLTKIELQDHARFIGWEILCLGRPAAGEAFTRGAYRQGLEVWRDGTPLYLEHGRFQGGSELLQSPWGLRGLPVTATLVCVARDTGLAAAVGSLGIDPAEDALFGVSQLQEVLVCRFLGTSVQQARQSLTRVWSTLRSRLLGKPPCIPRIWDT